MKNLKKSSSKTRKFTFATNLSMQQCLEQLRTWEAYTIDITDYDDGNASFKIYNYANSGRDAFGTLKYLQNDSVMISCHIDHAHDSWKDTLHILLWIFGTLIVMIIASLHSTEAMIIAIVALSILGVIEEKARKAKLIGVDPERDNLNRLHGAFVSRLMRVEL